MVMTQRHNQFKTSFEARSNATISVFDIFSVEGAASKFPKGTLQRKMEESQQPKSKSLKPEQN